MDSGKQEQKEDASALLLDDSPSESSREVGDDGSFGATSTCKKLRTRNGAVVVVRFFCMQITTVLAFLAVGLAFASRDDVAECLSALRAEEGSLIVEHNRLLLESERLMKELAEARQPDSEEASPPYFRITGSEAHTFPEMYGKVREQTIWTYWYHKDDCATSKSCSMPPQVQLCIDSVRKNKGSFEHVLLHADEVEKYLSFSELPVRWRQMKEVPQKQALMTALLARYGGVALDAATILLRPLDDYWDEMVSSGATFYGYMFRFNGEPWSGPEVLAPWLLMSRREGLLRVASRNQIVWMGDSDSTDVLFINNAQLVDQTLLPVLQAFNYNLPNCSSDPMVEARLFPQTTLDEHDLQCPEMARNARVQKVRGSPRNDMKLRLRDPRDGPLLPFAFQEGALLWDIEDSETYVDIGTSDPRDPMHRDSCSSPKECWSKVFRKRFDETPNPGEAPLLAFVPLIGHERAFQRMSQQEILSKSTSFFHQWLKLAGTM